MQENYFVEFGVESSNLNQTSDPVPSVIDITLQNQTYSVTLQELAPATIYFFRVSAVFDDVFQRYSELSAFRTYENGIENVNTFATRSMMEISVFIYLCRASTLPAIPATY